MSDTKQSSKIGHFSITGTNLSPKKMYDSNNSNKQLLNSDNLDTNKGALDVIHVFESFNSINTQPSKGIMDFIKFLQYDVSDYQVNIKDLSLPYSRYILDTNNKNKILVGPPLLDLLKGMNISQIKNLINSTNLSFNLDHETKDELIKIVIDLNQSYINSNLDLNEMEPTSTPPQIKILLQSPKQSLTLKLESKPLKNYRILKPIVPENYFPQQIINPVEGSQYIKSNPSEYNILESLMVSDIHILQKIVHNLGYVGFDGNKHELISIIWWSHILRKPETETDDRLLPPTKSNLPLLDLRLNPSQLKNLMTKTLSELQNLCQTSTLARVDCIFLLSTGYEPPQLTLNQTGQQVLENLIKVEGSKVMQLARFLYNFYEDYNYLVSPYQSLAYLKSKNYQDLDNSQLLDNYILNLNLENLESLSLNLGLIYPKYTNNLIIRLPTDKMIYYLNNLKHYKTIFNKPKETFNQSYCSTSDLNLDQTNTFKTYLMSLRDDEIFKLYNIVLVKWNSRIDMIQKVIEELSLHAKHWSYKKYGEDIYLAYGLTECQHESFQYYNIEELLKSFKQGPVFFKFGIPSNPGEFSNSSIKQLLHILQDQPVLSSAKTQTLINKIKYGLKQKIFDNQDLNYDFMRLNVQDQNKIYNYIIHLLKLAIYIKSPDSSEDICYLTDNNYSQVANEYTELLNIIEKLPEDAQSWLENLPTVTYEDDKLTIQDIYLHDALLSTLTGVICSSLGSKLILSSIVYIYQVGFGLTDLQFKQIIKERSPDLNNLDLI